MFYFQAKVKTLSNERCKERYDFVKPRDICAIGEDGANGCMGDSGGALSFFNKDGGYWVQIGVYAWMFSCENPNDPGGWARVTSYLDWIKKHISGQTCPTP